MSGNGHERRREDLPGYLLGALAPDEAAAMERHLEECESCREEASWLAPAVWALPEGVPRLAPPPALRERLLAEVAVDAAPGRGAGAAEAGWGRRAAARLRSPSSGSRGWRPALALGAVLLALVAVAGYEVGSNAAGGSSDAAGAVTVGHAPGVTATMVREGAGGTLRLAHLRQLPGAEVLEAWVRRDGRVEAVPALFVPDREGRAWTTIEDMKGVDTVMVTEEPKGGSAEPTSEPILTMRVDQ